MDFAGESSYQPTPSSSAAGGDDHDDHDRWDGSAPQELTKSRSHKVSGACAPCKRAHLACEPSRPCKRCISMSREDQCIDLPQKKRGRPKLSTSTAGAQALRVSRTTPLIIEQPPYGTDQGGPLSAPAFSSSFSRSSVGGGGGGVARINLLPSAQPPAPLSSSAPPETFFTPDYSVASPPFSTATPVVPPRPRPPRPLSMILLTTTDFFLLRASDSSVEVLGKPSTALQRSWMSDLLPSEDLLALFPLCQWLVSPPGVHLSTDPGTEAAIEGATWPELTLPAEGTPYPEKEVRMHKADGSLVAVNLRMHLGRGAGLDFRNPETFSRAYIVISCLVTHVTPPSSTSFPAPAPLPRPKSATSLAPDAGPSYRPHAAVADSQRHRASISVFDPPPLPRHHLRQMPSLPSISTLTHEVDRAQQSRMSSLGSSGGGSGGPPTFRNPFEASPSPTLRAPPPPPPSEHRSQSQTFRFQPRPQTGESHRPRGIVLPPPTMVGFGAHGRLASPGIYGSHHRPMSTDSQYSSMSLSGGGGGRSGSKDFLPGFASFAARGSVASIESSFSATPSDALWSPAPLDEPFRRRGSALRTGTGDSSSMDGVVSQPLEPPSFPFPHDSHHLHASGSRQ